MISIDRNIQNYTMRMNNKSSNIKWYIIGGLLLIAIVIIGIALTKGKVIRVPTTRTERGDFSYTLNEFKWKNKPIITSPVWTSTIPEFLPVSTNPSWMWSWIAELSIQPNIELSNPPIESINDETDNDPRIYMIAKFYDAAENEIPVSDRDAGWALGSDGTINIQDEGDKSMVRFSLKRKSFKEEIRDGVAFITEDIWNWTPQLNYIKAIFVIGEATDLTPNLVPLGTEIHKIVFELENSDIKIPYNLDSPIVIKDQADI